MPHKNPSATPGKTAWESASPIKANLRTTRNAPIKPQHNPSSIEQAQSKELTHRAITLQEGAYGAKIRTKDS